MKSGPPVWINLVCSPKRIRAKQRRRHLLLVMHSQPEIDRGRGAGRVVAFHVKLGTFVCWNVEVTGRAGAPHSAAYWPAMLARGRLTGEVRWERVLVKIRAVRWRK